MSAKRKTFSAAAEAAISSATTAALAGTSPGIFATQRERIAATLASPRAAPAANLPQAGGDLAREAHDIASEAVRAMGAAAPLIRASADKTNVLEQRVNEVAANLQAAEQRLAMISNSGGGIVAHQVPSVGASLVQRIEAGEADGFAALREGNSPKARLKLDASIRAALTRGGGSSEGGTMPSQPETGAVYGGPVRRLSLLEALPSRPTTRDAVEFVRITASDNAGVQFPEGTEKAEIDLEPDLVRAEIATVAGHTTASKQVLADTEALSAVVDRVMRGKVSSKAEGELVNGAGGPGHVEGLLTQAPTFVPTIATEPADIIGECLASMEDDGYTVGFVLLNPLDWFALQTERATPGGEYLFGSPAAPLAPSLWNRPVVLSSSVPRGTGVAVDPAYVTLLDRQQVTVEASEHHKDNFTKNLVTIRAEARIGLEVTDQWALRKFDLTPVASS